MIISVYIFKINGFVFRNFYIRNACNMKIVMLVFGTRLEAIKMTPLVKVFQAAFDSSLILVCMPGQHREMLDQV